MSEERPLIENSDRGFTINKQLGWSILVTLVGLIFYAGTTLSNLQNGMDSITTNLAAQQAGGTALEVRVRVLENQAGRFEEKLQSILNVVSRIDEKLDGQK